MRNVLIGLRETKGGHLERDTSNKFSGACYRIFRIDIPELIIQKDSSHYLFLIFVVKNI